MTKCKTFIQRGNSEKLDTEINEFLEANAVEVINVTSFLDRDFCYITIFYRTK